MSNKGISKELLVKELRAKSGTGNRWAEVAMSVIDATGEFKAGIRTNVDVLSLNFIDEYKAVEVNMKDESNCKCRTLIFGPSHKYLPDPKKYTNALTNKMKLLLHLVNLPLYPYGLNQALLKVKEWSSNVCNQMIEEFTERRSKMDQLLCAGVFVIAKVLLG